MKILYVCTSTDTGGAEIALRRLALAAHKEGHQVKILSLKSLGAVASLMRKEGLDLESFDITNRWSLLQTVGSLARLIQTIQSFQPDIVHAFLYRAIQLCRMAKKHVSFKLVTSPHYDLSRKNYFLRLLDRALKEADDISGAESFSTAEFLKKNQKYKEEKVFLAENGVDLSFFKPDETKRLSVRKKLGLSDRDIVFCCVARLSKEKNHLLLLQSFAALQRKNPAVKLLLVGDGPQKDQLQKFVSRNQLEEKVLFAGEVSNVYDFLLASDVFVLPSYIESLPLSLLESCSCEKPAIVSKAGDMPRVVLHGETGFVCNDKDGVILTVLMAELADNKTLRQEMGKKARIRMQLYYSAPEQKYLSLYHKIS